MKKRSCILLMLCAFLITGCSFPGLGKSVNEDGIVIAGGNTTERQILSEIVAQMINHYETDIDTTLINNLGSTMLILQSLQRKDTNISGAMYTGTSLTGELGLPPTSDADEAMEEVVKGYAEQYDMVWFPSYGFENTYAFMVSRKLADTYQLTKVSDLKPYAEQLRAGVDTAWINRQGDGYEDFKQLYGFDFKDVYPMEIGLVYNAVNADKMDVVLGYSTDGRIASYDLVVLEDDLHLFPPYEASPVITKKLLRKYPDLETVLLKLEQEISSATMQELNRLSDEEHKEPYVVAREFLQAHDYFEAKDVIPLAQRDRYKTIISDILPLKEKGGK